MEPGNEMYLYGWPKGRFPLGGIFRAERIFFCPFQWVLSESSQTAKNSA